MRHLGALMVAAAAVFVGWGSSDAGAHCQVPCGIYDDDARIDEIAEHITTVEKAMKQIDNPETNANQRTRWVMNKETHAEAIQEIAWKYFLTQRVKPVAGSGRAAYLEKLALLHEISVEAMKCKQTTDQAHVVNLRALLKKYAHAAGLKH